MVRLAPGKQHRVAQQLTATPTLDTHVPAAQTIYRTQEDTHKDRESTSNHACTWTDPRVSVPLPLQCGLLGPKTSGGLAVTAGGSPAVRVDQQVTDAKDKIQHF